MLSKSIARATTAALAVLLFSVSCSRLLPWRNEPIGEEVNLAFTLERNLVELQTVRVNNRAGRFLLGTAAQRSVLDTGFAGRDRKTVMQISEHATVPINPVAHDLRGVADGIIGVEAWRNHAITIDYRSGLVTYQQAGIYPAYMTVYRFTAEPMIYASVNGRQTAVIVDTTSPDTLVLPGPPGRATVDVSIAGTAFGPTDVQYADVSHPRIGNRLLSRFLVTIDYGKRVVGVWRDPRIL